MGNSVWSLSFKESLYGVFLLKFITFLINMLRVVGPTLALLSLESPPPPPHYMSKLAALPPSAPRSCFAYTNSSPVLCSHDPSILLKNTGKPQKSFICMDDVY